MNNRNYDLRQSIYEPTQIMVLRHVNKTYHTSVGEFPALKNINITIESGKLVSVLGKSGSGKSTLINLMAGIDHPSSGEVIINGSDIHKMSEGKIAVWRGKNLGIVFQFFQLLPTLSVLDNTMLPMDFCGTYRKTEREEIARNLLRTLEIEDLSESFPNSISAGHQQCAAIARALANDPPIILADEPTGNLDSKTGEMVINIFKKLVSSGKTIIMVTHDRKLANQAQRILLLRDGILINEGLTNAFLELNEIILAKMDSKSETFEVNAGKSIFLSTQERSWFWILTRGAMTLSVEEKNIVPDASKTKLFAGDIIINSDHVYKFTATEDCQILSIPLPEIISLSNNEIMQVEQLISRNLDTSGVNYATKLA
ncbi:MAG: ABC transporter ATP-binding protein [Anaerolineaceae bacterium]